MTHDRPDDLALIQTTLLEWFAAHARDLPWRRTRDPYRIMVSEVMLQQTQVDRVIPKYHAFLALFPTIAALAEAPTADVIRAWAGLGYNRRAVNLQRAARAVLERHAGQFPETVAELLTLPGIGPYTAGAIACFAFELDVAFLDTNIRRALRRLLLPAGEPEPTERILLNIAAAAVPPGSGWAWNQAIMELGALICLAAAPICRRCPVRECCRDYAARSAADSSALDGFAGRQPIQPRQRIAERRQAPFAGSSRYYRGRVVAELRRAPEGLTLAQLGPLVREDYSMTEADWLGRLVADLARDGLAILDGDHVRLPD